MWYTIKSNNKLNTFKLQKEKPGHSQNQSNSKSVFGIVESVWYEFIILLATKILYNAISLIIIHSTQILSHRLRASYLNR